MPDILLATLNAKYIHASFGLRYLLANLGELRGSAALMEFDINQRPLDVVEAILKQAPRIVGLGVYIWNTTETAEVAAALKRLRPELVVVMGGPEVSYETEEQAIVQWADYVITGEADLAFAALCRRLLNGEKPAQRIVAAPLPDFTQLELPYELYTDEDVAHRVIYVEASRGCPFSCEFCLSSLDIPVRQVPLPQLLEALRRLLDRGVKQFKFVDRTFNLNLQTSRLLLQFFLERHRPGLFIHFEMIPDRLPEALRELIAQFPPGALQFEVGVQSLDDDVCARISRRQDVAKMEQNFRFLREKTGVHVHADLIAGLPGESWAGFACGFDRLLRLGPQEIQVGILKRLRGTPIARHDQEWGMRYHPHPPYEVLETSAIDFSTMQRLRRLARYWDLFGNSGNFVESAPLLWAQQASPFVAFSEFCDWLYARLRRTDSIPLVHLAELLLEYLHSVAGLDARTVAEALWRDYQRGNRLRCPEFLRQHLPEADTKPLPARASQAVAPKRQARHLGGKAMADEAALSGRRKPD